VRIAHQEFVEIAKFVIRNLVFREWHLEVEVLHDLHALHRHLRVGFQNRLIVLSQLPPSLRHVLDLHFEDDQAIGKFEDSVWEAIPGAFPSPIDKLWFRNIAGWEGFTEVLLNSFLETKTTLARFRVAGSPVVLLPAKLNPLNRLGGFEETRRRRPGCPRCFLRQR